MVEVEGKGGGYLSPRLPAAVYLFVGDIIGGVWWLRISGWIMMCLYDGDGISILLLRRGHDVVPGACGVALPSSASVTLSGGLRAYEAAVILRSRLHFR